MYSKKNKKNQLAVGFEPLSLRHHATRATNTTFLYVKFQFYCLYTVSIHVWDVLVDCKFALLVRNVIWAQWIIDPPGWWQPFEKSFNKKKYMDINILQKTAKTSFKWNEPLITLQGIPLVRHVLPSSEGVAVTDVAEELTVYSCNMVPCLLTDCHYFHRISLLIDSSLGRLHLIADVFLLFELNAQFFYAFGR